MRRNARSLHAAPRRGFTLPEVVIAVALLVIGLFGVFDLLAVNRRVHLTGARAFEALHLAESRLAVLQAAGGEAVLADAARPQPTLPIGRLELDDRPFGLRWRLDVRPVPDFQGACLATVQVAWGYATGEESATTAIRSVSVTRLIPPVGEGKGQGS